MLKVGVLGTGNLGEIHLNTWKEFEQTEIAGFYEFNDSVAEQTKKTFLVNRFSDVDHLIEECDLIDITAFADDSFEWCQKAIRKGKHVFIEKNLANSMDEAKQLVKLIKESNVKFQVGYAERFNPAFAALQDLSVKPVFIEAQNIISVNHPEQKANLFFDLMISDIDIILSIVKSDVKNISAVGTSIHPQTNDMINARIEFYNGCAVNITWAKLPVPRVHQMRFYESGKFIDIDFINKETLAIYSVRLQLEKFRNSVLNNTTPVVSAIDGLNAMDIAHKILQKIKHGY
jgi:predicted dehydrogenase